MSGLNPICSASKFVCYLREIPSAISPKLLGTFMAPTHQPPVNSMTRKGALTPRVGAPPALTSVQPLNSDVIVSSRETSFCETFRLFTACHRHVNMNADITIRSCSTALMQMIFSSQTMANLPKNCERSPSLTSYRHYRPVSKHNALYGGMDASEKQVRPGRRFSNGKPKCRLARISQSSCGRKRTNAKIRNRHGIQDRLSRCQGVFPPSVAPPSPREPCLPLHDTPHMKAPLGRCGYRLFPRITAAASHPKLLLTGAPRPPLGGALSTPSNVARKQCQTARWINSAVIPHPFAQPVSLRQYFETEAIVLAEPKASRTSWVYATGSPSLSADG